MAQQQFQDDLPQCTVIAIGHLDHGKTTLAAAMTKLASLQDRARPVRYDWVDNAGEQEVQGTHFRIAQVEYATGTRRYTHLDCPGPADYVACLRTGLVPVDGAILVISASDGLMPQTREQLLLVRQANIPVLAVFLNKSDLMDSPELLAQAEREARELLAGVGLAGDAVPIVRGSALKALECKSGDPNAPEYAPLLELLRSLDSNLGR